MTTQNAAVIPETLSDNSVAYNVELKCDEAAENHEEGVTLTLACLTRTHAERLAKLINQCAWIQR